MIKEGLAEEQWILAKNKAGRTAAGFMDVAILLVIDPTKAFGPVRLQKAHCFHCGFLPR